MKWEYKTLRFETRGLVGGVPDEKAMDAALNSLGRDGWELVSALDTNIIDGATRYIVAILKRPVS